MAALLDLGMENKAAELCNDTRPGNWPTLQCHSNLVYPYRRRCSRAARKSEDEMEPMVVRRQLTCIEGFIDDKGIVAFPRRVVCDNIVHAFQVGVSRWGQHTNGFEIYGNGLYRKQPTIRCQLNVIAG